MRNLVESPDFCPQNRRIFELWRRFDVGKMWKWPRKKFSRSTLKRQGKPAVPLAPFLFLIISYFYVLLHHFYCRFVLWNLQLLTFCIFQWLACSSPSQVFQFITWELFGQNRRGCAVQKVKLMDPFFVTIMGFKAYICLSYCFLFPILLLIFLMNFFSFAVFLTKKLQCILLVGE